MERAFIITNQVQQTYATLIDISLKINGLSIIQYS